MEIRKITDGCVIQTFEDGKCVAQKFIAGGEVEYEDGFGDALPPEKLENFRRSGVYQPFDMVQPNTEIVISVHGGLIETVNFPEHFDNVKIVVKDYDTDGFSEGIEKDGDGEFVRSEWG